MKLDIGPHFRPATHPQKIWIRRIAVAAVLVLFSLGAEGFVAQQPNPLLVKTECTEIDAPYSTLAPAKMSCSRTSD